MIPFSVKKGIMPSVALIHHTLRWYRKR
jgi:hypothetical protein